MTMALGGAASEQWSCAGGVPLADTAASNFTAYLQPFWSEPRRAAGQTPACWPLGQGERARGELPPPPSG